MEPHKTEAARRMQKRVNGRLQSIVEKEIVAMDKSIREFYDEELSYSAIDLAWMVTKDSCFLFEFMLNFVRTRQGNKDFRKDCVVEGGYDAVLSSSLTTPTRRSIFHDLVLLENQMPLFVLEHLLAIAFSPRDPEKILGDILSRFTKMDVFLVFRWGMPRPYKKQKLLHYLEVSYYRHVGWHLAGYKEKAFSVKDRRLLQFGWTKSIFTGCCPRWMRGRCKGLWHSFLSFAHSTVAYCHVQIVRVRTNCLVCWPPSNTGDEEHADAFRLKLPSVAELKKKGINLCVVTPKNSRIRANPQGIRWVQFEEKTSTLYMPEVRIDHFRHALLRNFIALEYTSTKYSPYPITAFVVSGLCKPIDDVRLALHKYLRREYKILWNEFKYTYFAKPWIVAGSVVATLLLLMTLLQVFCLFYTCNRSQ